MKWPAPQIGSGSGVTILRRRDPFSTPSTVPAPRADDDPVRAAADLGTSNRFGRSSVKCGDDPVARARGKPLDVVDASQAAERARSHGRPARPRMWLRRHPERGHTSVYGDRDLDDPASETPHSSRCRRSEPRRRRGSTRSPLTASPSGSRATSSAAGQATASATGEVAALAGLHHHAPRRKRRRSFRRRHDRGGGPVAPRPEIGEQSNGRNRAREERQLDSDVAAQAIERQPRAEAGSG